MIVTPPTPEDVSKFLFARSKLSKHGDGTHDEQSHGNWSRGSTAQKLYHASVRRNRESIRQEGLRLSDVDRQHIWATSEPDEIEHFSFMEFDVWEIDAEGLQLAGEFHPGLLRGVENTRVLHEVVPPSRLKLVRQYGRLPAGMSARMVSEWDGEKWVSRSMRQTTGRFGTPLSKHYGPGPHPGTMTEQTVHGTQSGEIDFDLTDINTMRSSLLTGVISPSTAKSWALEHVNRLRPVLFGLDSPELAIDPKNYQTRLGSYIQRLNNLYYTAENLQYSDEELDEFTKRETKRTPEFPHGPSIKWPRVYEALRRLGYSKEKAARISNAHWNKYRRWGRAGNPGPASEEEYRSERGRKPRKHKGIPFPKSRRVKKTITPDDLGRFLYARSLVRKHTPGGVEHDQADHGNWSSGSTQDWRSLYQEARTKEGPRINSEFTTYVQGLPVRVIASLNTVTYGGQIRTYFSDGSSSARSFSGDEEGLLARIEEQLQETEGNIAALPPQPLPPPRQKSLFEDDKYKTPAPGSKKKTRSATGKTEGDITDPEPTEGPWSDGDPWDETIAEDYANDIFNAELTLGDGETYRAEIDSVYDAGSGNFEATGTLSTDEYGQIARFRRSVDLQSGSVYNAEFFIDEEYQGKGIGTIMLAHWESELAAAGVTEMHLGTAEIGKYAWAMSGYEFEDNYPDSALERMRGFLSEVDNGYGPDDFSDSYLAPFAQYPEVVEEVRDFVDNWEGEGFPAWSLASLGADKEQIDGYYGPAHFGKELMLTGDSWDGVKQIA